MNIETALRQAENILNNKNFKSVNLDCEILMSKVLDKDRKYIILNLKKNLENYKLDYFKSLVEERSFGKPIAYLVEKKRFLEI